MIFVYKTGEAIRKNTLATTRSETRSGIFSGTSASSLPGNLSETRSGIFSGTKVRNLLIWAVMAGALSGCASLEKIFREKKVPLKGQRSSLYNTEHAAKDKEAFSLDKMRASAVAVSQWTQAGLNSAHHMGALQLSGSASWPMAKVWQKQVSNAVVLPVMPIATSERIFVVNHEGFLTSYDWGGKQIWSVQVNLQQDFFGMGGGLATDGQRIYVTTPHRWVLALDFSTGKVIWSYALSHPARNGPALSNGRLAILTLSNQTILLDAASGKEIWDDQGLREDTLILGGSIPALTSDRVIVGTASGEIVALSLGQGERLWDRQLVSMGSAEGEKNFRHIHAYPVIIGANVYATSDNGPIVCFDLYSGDVVWSHDAGGMQTPVVVGDAIFTISTTGRLVALNRHTGQEFWTLDLPQTDQWFGPVMAGGLLYVLSNNGQLGALDPLKKGALVSVVQLKETYTMAPIVIKGGLLLLSKDGQLSFYKRTRPDENKTGPDRKKK